MITEIEINKLENHPQNVRKNYNDIEELADSIKAQGILQNLTVVPKPGEADKYLVVIGNRRLLAANKAGLETAPCYIADMDEKEQVSVMLLENIQRNDLTIYEQAQGFQIMLDLGETEDQIAEKSGFSKTTIRRRLNIAKLDQKILKEKEENNSFQLTLKDLYELEKVEDIATRNKILEEAGSSRDIIWKAQSAVTETERKKKAEIIVKLMDEAGIEKAPAKCEQELYSGKWETVKEYSLDKEPPKGLGIPKKEKGKLYYVRYFSSIHLIKRSEKKKETKEELARKEIEAKKKQIKEIMKEMNKRKHEFIGNIISGKIAPVKEVAEVREEIWCAMVKMDSYMSPSGMRRFFTGKEEYQCSQEEKEEAAKQVAGLSMEYQMLLVMSYGLDNMGDVYDYYLHHNAKRCEQIKAAYAVLERYGWSFQEEESKILNGTHEFYVSEKRSMIKVM